MANALVPAEWKKVLKDQKDAQDTSGVTKALDAYAKVEPRAKDAPQPVLDALEEIVDAAKSSRSANSRDKTRKPVVDFLDDVLKDAAAMKVKAERYLQEKNERDREGEDDEGGDDERAKLTAQLIKVKKLDAGAARGFVLALGGKAHGLVISKTAAVSSDHKKRARNMRDGNGRIFTGLVYGESGKYVFQMEDKPPNGLAKVIKKTASMQTDLKSIRVTLRGPEGFELDDETDAEEVADLGPEVGDTGTENDADGREAAAFKARTDALTPALKDGLKQGGELRQALTLAYSQAQVAARKKDYAAAGGLLDEIERRLARRADTGTDAPDQPSAGESDAFKLRLNALKVRYDRVKDLPAGASVKAAFVEAVKAVAARKPQPAVEALETLEARLTTAERTAGVTDEIQGGDGDVVAYRTALLKWQTCRTRVRDSVETLITNVLSDPETKALDQEDRDDIEAAIPTLREEIAAFDDKLDDAVNGYLNAPPAKKPRAMKGIRKAINAYRSALDNPLLDAMGDSGYGNFPVASEIDSALKEFEGLLVRPVTV